MKYYLHDNTLVRQASVSAVPEVYAGKGDWVPHPDPLPVHEGREVSEAQATAWQRQQDAPRKSYVR